MGDLAPRDVPERHRYELEAAGAVAYAEYERQGGVQTMTHTVVPEAARGGGIAGALVKFALEDARRRGLRIVPQCSYVAAYIKKHPEYADLVAG